MSNNNLFKNDSGVSTILGNILNIMILTLTIGSIAGVFYLRAEDLSQKALLTGYADLGNQITRDITNMYFNSVNSTAINITEKRKIPLTIGGKPYKISLNNQSNMVAINIVDAGNSYNSNTLIESIGSNDTSININYTKCQLYSASGEINIDMNRSGSITYLCIY